MGDIRELWDDLKTTTGQEFLQSLTEDRPLKQFTASGVAVEIPEEREEPEFVSIREWWDSGESLENFKKMPKVLEVRSPNGRLSSELTTSVSHPRLNNGRETLIPTLIEGRELSVPEATKWAINSGLRFPSFGSIPKAEAYAVKRSKAGGAATQGFLGRPTSYNHRIQTDDELREQILEASGSRWYSYPGEVIAGTSRGVANTMIAALAGSTETMASATDLIGIDNDVVEWVHGYHVAAQEAIGGALPVTPGFEDSWTRSLSEGFGSIGVAMLAGAGGVAGIAAFGATVQFSNTYNQARSLGASEEDSLIYAWASAIVGGVSEPMSAVMPALKILKRTDKATGGVLYKEIFKRLGREVPAGSIREAATEIVQEIPDETLRQAYIKERTMFDAIDALVEVGVVGGLLGGFLPVMTTGARIALDKRAGRAPLGVEPEAAPIDVAPESEALLGEQGPAPLPPIEGLAPGEEVITDHARDTLLDDHAKRVEAGQKDPTPSQAMFAELGLDDMANATRKERAAFIAKLQEKADEAGRATGTEGAVTPEVREAQPEPTSEEAAPTQAVERAEAVEPAAEQGATSIKNAVVDQERQKRGLVPLSPVIARDFGTAKAIAERRMDDDPRAQDVLINQLKNEPKAIDDIQDFMLLDRQVSLQNEYDKTLVELDAARQAEDVARIADLQSQEETLLQELVELYDLTQAVGTATGRGLSARRAMAAEDFSLVKMIAKKRKAKDVSQLSIEDEVVVREASRRIADLEERLSQHTARITELESEQASIHASQDLVAATTKRKAKTRTAKAKAEVESAWKDFEGKISGKLFANPLDPELVASATKLARAYIRLGVSSFNDFLDAVRNHLGEGRAGKLGETLDNAWNTAIAESKPVPKRKLETPAAVSRFAKQLAKFFASTGIVERNALIDAVHSELVRTFPEMTRREAMDAISGYGQFSALSKDELDVLLRDLKGQMQQIAKLEDMRAGLAPLKTGQERPTPSDAQRQLIQQVNEMKRRGGFAVTDPATQLKSALGALKTRLRNQIADLDAQIESGERIVKTRTDVIPDEEVVALKRQRDVRQERFNEIFGKKGLTDEQRLRNATAAVKKSIAEYERRIAEKDLAPKRRVSKTPDTPELQALRARRDALRDEFKHLQDLANPKMTPDERALSALKANMRRRIADYRERLANKDFAPRRRKERKLDAEGERLRFEAEQAKAEFLKELAADTRNRRTKLQKALGLVPSAIQAHRSIVASSELSALLRQGKFGLAGRPQLAPPMVKVMIAAARSKAAASRLMHEITQRPNAPLYKRARLGLTDPDGSINQKEEDFLGTWTEHIPIVAGSGRAHVAGLNWLRVNLFDIFAETLGKNGEVTDAEARIIADFVNDLTGRASFGRFEHSTAVASTIFFAPKFKLSRFKLLFRLLKLPLSFASKSRAERLIAKEYARSLAGISLYYSAWIMALYALVGLPGEDKKWDIEHDPRSSDFMKIRIGNVRIDPLAGLSQVTVFLGRLSAGETKSLPSGKIAPISGAEVPFGGLTTSRVVWNFLRNSLAPSFGTILNVRQGENVIGEKATPVTTSRDLIIPIAYRDIWQNMTELGVPKTVGLTILEFFGESTQPHSVDETKTPGTVHRLSSDPGKDATEAELRKEMAIFARRSGITRSQGRKALAEKYKKTNVFIRGTRRKTPYGKALERFERRWPKGR